jgi:DNA mismatch repair protein MutS
MKQYKEIKENNRDSILFFRLGDFYEMFFDDAVVASKELGLTLTSRNREKDQEIPMAGIPYHSAPGYIAKLVSRGYRVAICEQTEESSEKGIAKREVVKIVTPGTIVDLEYLDEKSNNFLMGVVFGKESLGMAYVDITTGEFKVTELSGGDILFKLMGEINKVAPKEIVLSQQGHETLKTYLETHPLFKEIRLQVTGKTKGAEEYLKNYFNIISLESFSLKDKELAVEASAMVLKYVVELQKGNSLPISKIEYQSSEGIMELNLVSQRNLDLFYNHKEGNSSGTLLNVLDRCGTSMGSRLLKSYLKNPLQDISQIKSRQEDIEYFLKEALLREELRERISQIYDIERIIGKLVMGSENGRDLLALKNSIRKALEIYKLLSGASIFNLQLEELLEIYNLIEKTISEEAPFSIREGGIIKRGYDSSLDELHKLSETGKEYLLEMENRERERTGIKNLKIKYNRVFGYFIEVTKANLHLIPEDYQRKQTLSNAERYIISELKEYEEKILNAKERIESLEYHLFKEISQKVREKREGLQDLADQLAYLDVMTNLAHISLRYNYVKPELHAGKEIEIIGGRHPIVETLIPHGEFIKNNLVLDEEREMIILTGPNMSGKSTYMKQVALILIMAQMGSFVPADYARIGVVDKIFTRIGASDDLLSGQSTFMLEMSEVACIVNSATENSFIILDEVGRGTSTSDGISIATAITEYIHDKIGAKTIFATHYHELTQLEARLKRAENFRIEVKENSKEVIFTHEIVKGGADKSYGIEVARLAGLPKEILDRSKVMLGTLENRKALIEKNLKREQLSLFAEVEEPTPEIVEKSTEQFPEEEKIAIRVLKELDVNGLTPLEALLKLNELKRLIK